MDQSRKYFFIGLGITAAVTIWFGIGFAIVYCLAYMTAYGAIYTIGFTLWSFFWPSTHGSVERTWIQIDSGDEDSLYRPKIVYRYIVDGNDYINDDYDIARTAGSHDWAKKVISRYEGEKEIRIFYQPNHPESAILHRMPDLAGIGLMGFLVFITYVLILLIIGLHNGRITWT